MKYENGDTKAKEDLEIHVFCSTCVVYIILLSARIHRIKEQ